MAQQGWVKIHRKLRECYLWKSKEPFDKRSAWIDLLLSANHADNKTIINNKVETVTRGTFITSEVKLSEHWKWDRGKVRRFLKLLESDNMIKKIPTAKLYTVIEIVNYDEYQSKESATSETVDITRVEGIDTTSNEQVTNKSRTSNEHKQECIKNDKELIVVQIEKLWSLYPNKKGKADYLKKVPSLLKTISFEELQRTVERYVKATKGTELKFIKNGSTFFNGGYVDYLDKNYEKIIPIKENRANAGAYEAI